MDFLSSACSCPTIFALMPLSMTLLSLPCKFPESRHTFLSVSHSSHSHQVIHLVSVQAIFMKFSACTQIAGLRTNSLDLYLTGLIRVPLRLLGNSQRRNLILWLVLTDYLRAMCSLRRVRQTFKEMNERSIYTMSEAPELSFAAAKQ